MPMDETGQLSYEDVLGWIRRFAAVIAENKEYLTELDSAIGDADHGINMDRGFQAVLPKLDALPGDDVGAAFRTVGSTLISTVGGASGPLYGTLFLQYGIATAGQTTIGLAQWLVGLEAAIAAIQRLGKAEPGDKTMLDALIPGRDALKQALSAGVSPASALADSRGRYRGRHASHHPARRPQGSGELPWRAQRRPPGPRRDLVVPAASGRSRRMDDLVTSRLITFNDKR